MKFKKVDAVFLIAIAVLVILTVDLLLVEAHRAAITGLWSREEFQSEEFFAKLGLVFVICIIGNLLPVPTPYSWFVCFGFAYIGESIFFPMVFALVAALGCLIGELGGYIVGRGTAEVISEERAKNLSKYQEYLTEHPKLAPFLIFLFGLTPLNDDMLTVPLGLIKYPAKKTIIWMWLGKLGMMTIMAYNVLGICGLLGGENWEVSLITLFAIVIMIYLMVRVDVVKKVKDKIDANNEE
ncbi:MAG: VTT domain-containing protein [Promethearchaeia archaeon]